MSRNLLPQNGNCILQSRPVAGGVSGAGRTEGTDLPIRQIAAQHREPCAGKSIGESNQKRRICVGTGAVGQYQAASVCNRWRMQKPPDRWMGRRDK